MPPCFSFFLSSYYWAHITWSGISLWPVWDSWFWLVHLGASWHWTWGNLLAASHRSHPCRYRNLATQTQYIQKSKWLVLRMYFQMRKIRITKKLHLISIVLFTQKSDLPRISLYKHTFERRWEIPIAGVMKELLFLMTCASCSKYPDPVPQETASKPT